MSLGMLKALDRNVARSCKSFGMRLPQEYVPDFPSRLYAKGRLAHISFIAGTNLDEGLTFILTSFNSTAQLRQWMISNSTPPVVSVTTQDQVVDKILKLYPDEPALDSPSGTDNETFGLNLEFKRASAAYGDIAFNSLRRELTQTASGQGVKVYTYLFTDPQTEDDLPFLGVPHGTDVPYVFGALQNGPTSVILSRNLIDYWFSFAMSLDPNDGLGNASCPLWTQYMASSEKVVQLNSVNLTMIPETFRAEQIAYLISNADALCH